MFMCVILWLSVGASLCFFFSSRRRHTRCALVTEFRRVLFRSHAVDVRIVANGWPLELGSTGAWHPCCLTPLQLAVPKFRTRPPAQEWRSLRQLPAKGFAAGGPLRSLSGRRRARQIGRAHV